VSPWDKAVGFLMAAVGFETLSFGRINDLENARKLNSLLRK